MFRVTLSNRLPVLADAVVRDWKARPPGLFVPEHIIIPSAGIRQWLGMRIADSCGIAANLRFRFPAHWIWEIIAQVGGGPIESPFAPETLTWRIHGWLCGENALNYVRLGDYLRVCDALMRFELAARLAALFDRYISYRPDWLEAWSENVDTIRYADAAARADGVWQAALWRYLLQASTQAAQHPSAKLFETLTRAGAEAATRYCLPSRVTLFAVPAMSPLYMSILKRLAAWVDVNCYLMSPCSEYWFDLESTKSVARRELRHGQHDPSVETGNALLTLWGNQSRDYLAHMMDLCEGDFEDLHVRPTTGTDLGRLQDAITSLQPLQTLDEFANDASLVFHNAHSLTRELEILHDQLLLRLRSDPGLTPADILVVTPNLEAAGALIDAVFGGVPEEDVRHIPYRLAGIAPAHGTQFWEHFSNLLDLPARRCEAQYLFSLLEYPATARRFGLDSTALETVKRWWLESGVRWGLDSEDWVDAGPANAPPGGCTLDDGLRRMYLGFAMPTDGEQVIDGCLPYEDIEGQAAIALDGVWQFLRCLQEWRVHARDRCITAVWGERIQHLLSSFYANDTDVARLIQELQTGLAKIATHVERAGASDQPLPLAVFKAALAAQFGGRVPGAVPSGCVTFAGMTPLRYLPYRLVCCIGMNHDAFPGVPAPEEYDLMAAVKRKGDPDRRSEDRNVFLDLLLAAECGFYVSFTGRSQRDNAEQPPSVLVADLLDYLRKNGDGSSPMSDVSAWVTQHPLQPFAQAYFHGGPELVTFRHEYREALREGQADSAATAPTKFFQGPLEFPVAASQSVALSALEKFFKHPVRYLAQQRLGLYLYLDELDLPAEEAFETGLKDRQKHVEELSEWRLRGMGEESAIRRAELYAGLPGGRLATIDALLAHADSQRIVDGLHAVCVQARQPLGPHEIVLALDGCTLQANFTALYALDGAKHANDQWPVASRQVFWTAGRLGAGKLLSYWLWHLALCAVCGPELAPTTHIVTTEAPTVFASIDSDTARRQLEYLISLYWQGQIAPLPFFPRAAFAYAESDGKLDVASREWLGGPYGPKAESDDPYYRLAFGSRSNDALTADFMNMAQSIFGPLLESRREHQD